MTDTKPPESRVSLAFRVFGALAGFLILTVIFWELVLGALLFAGWLREKGWPAFGLVAKVFGVLLAVLMAIMTVTFFVAWVILLVRAIRDRKI
jgi:hypothetical protein